MKKYALGLAIALALPTLAYAAEPAAAPEAKKCCCCDKPVDSKGCGEKKSQGADHTGPQMD